MTIQNQPSAGKLQGNKISIITTNPQQMSTQTPVVLQQHQKITKKGSTPSSGSDFLSSIMQAVGIQVTELNYNQSYRLRILKFTYKSRSKFLDFRRYSPSYIPNNRPTDNSASVHINFRRANIQDRKDSVQN